MSLRFYFGPSGAGKSRQLYEEIIKRAEGNPKQNFLIIVPDQFTMQTQKDLVTFYQRGGILNIDVLSFGRLGYRIMEEIGGKHTPVLDDTGKSLVLQKVAANLKEDLPTLGGFLHKQGYIHEVKSAISEFMQYGIEVEDVSKLIAFAGKRSALVQKLKDLQTLYRGFLDYIHGNFITTEETLDVLRKSLKKSKLLQESVIVLDGFTGFTPIQSRFIQELMRRCQETIVGITLGTMAGEEAGSLSGKQNFIENPYEQDGEQKLFHLSKKTVADLEKLAVEAGVKRGQDIFIFPVAAFQHLTEQKTNKIQANRIQKSEIEEEAERNVWQNKEKFLYNGRLKVRWNTKNRFAKSPALLHLEQNLFRYCNIPYQKPQQEIHIFEATTPKEEVHQAGLLLSELIRKEKLAYRDIAVIAGDLEGYAPYVEEEFNQLSIPYFIDRTTMIVLNPMIEYMKSALGLYLKDFSYESVFHYLRSGLADISREEIDELENYIIQTGIRGYRKWKKIFTHKPAWAREDEEALKRLNDIRERFISQVAILHQGNHCFAQEYVNGLYDFLVQNQVEKKLADYEKFFTKEGQLSKAMEYAQIYRLVMDLLNQIYELLGQEKISRQEFYDILEAGFGEIEVGTIPQNVDRVLVGDIERTRLKQVKVLFFLGVNDGNIPKSSTKGGIISDMDREFLRESELELAPSPREQMYIQRLYLYLNMTKPSEKLYLSYARMSRQGKSIRPSYLIDTVLKMFSGLKVQYPEKRSDIEQIVTPKEGISYLAKQLREYVEGSMPTEQEPFFFTLYQAYGKGEFGEKRDLLKEAAFLRYQETGLSKAVARALYGIHLENSVTRLETFSACAYRHFLQYGLSLKERQEFGFETVDIGNVYHAVLEIFAQKLEASTYTWFDFPQEFARNTIAEALEEYAATYGDTILYSSARNEYAITRMKRILERTVLVLQSQLKKGVFQPEEYEFSFHFAKDIESINIALSDKEKMRIQGRIDRIDVAEEEDKVYVKVIDYKSGNHQFDLAALYYGLQLQLVIYMNAAMEMEAKKHPNKEIIPAALLYYHIDDPTIETPVELPPEEINEQILSKLRMNGVVNSEPDIVRRLDYSMGEKSDVIPVERKKDGSLSARSSVMSREELQVISNYVNRKVKSIGREILDGQIAVNPYQKDSNEACTYCPYQKVCGFDNSIPGYEKRELEDLEKEEVLERMRNEYGN